MTRISQKRREAAATVHVNGKAKYPVDSHQTAESAIHLINNAKPPLTAPQKATVRREAAKFGVHSASTPTPKKRTKKGSA